MAATQAYYDWVAAGRPFRLATPIAELKALARRYGIGFLGDIGSDDERHLQAAFPEDHCPFSYTAWPVPLPGYVVCAIDLVHEKGLAEALLRDAKAGRAPWVKYLNFAGRNYSVRRGWEPVWNADAHLHISIRSDWTDRSIGSYDPLGDDMDATQAAQLAEVHKILTTGERTGAPNPTPAHANQTAGGGVPILYLPRQIHEIGGALGGMLTAVQQLALRPPVQAAPVDVEVLAGAVAAMLAPRLGAEAEAAVRRVLGAVDGATPAG